jgi:hypothetical protein
MQLILLVEIPQNTVVRMNIVSLHRNVSTGICDELKLGKTLIEMPVID